jgi:hypothetical protein
MSAVSTVIKRSRHYQQLPVERGSGPKLRSLDQATLKAEALLHGGFFVRAARLIVPLYLLDCVSPGSKMILSIRCRLCTSQHVLGSKESPACVWLRPLLRVIAAAYVDVPS